MRTKKIPLVKVLWRHHGFEEATWELEDEMQKKYPELFQPRGRNFGDEILLRGEECKNPGKFELFLKKGKIVNCHPYVYLKYSYFRTQMIKRTSPLNSSREI